MNLIESLFFFLAGLVCGVPVGWMLLRYMLKRDPARAEEISKAANAFAEEKLWGKMPPAVAAQMKTMAEHIKRLEAYQSTERRLFPDTVPVNPVDSADSPKSKSP